jgi:hypothetical protein
MTDHATLAELFLRATSQELMNEPRFATRALAQFDPKESAILAAELSHATLASAKARLPDSQAAIAFEAITVSNRHALLESVGRSYGDAARSALARDPEASALLPERSQCFLGAWVFQDHSFLLVSRTMDDSFAELGAALEACEGFKSSLDPAGLQKFERDKLRKWDAQGCFPMSPQALEALLRSISQTDMEWSDGVRVLDRDSQKALAPGELVAIAKQLPNTSKSLDAAIAAAFGESNSPFKRATP